MCNRDPPFTKWDAGATESALFARAIIDQARNLERDWPFFDGLVVEVYWEPDREVGETLTRRW